MSGELIKRVAQAICSSRTCEGYACCQWPANLGRRHKCPVDKGNYDEAAKDAIKAVQTFHGDSITQALPRINETL